MFSELIDEIVLLSKKANLRESHIIPYLNATIRECQTKEFFYRDRIEITIPITTDGSFIWDRPNRIRNIEVVRYPFEEGYYEAPDNIPRIPPGRIKPESDYYYYGGPTYFVFRGVAINTTILMSYFEYSRRFKYYPDPALRPAVFDFETETWSYPTGSGTDAENEAKRDLVWHWLFDDWYEMVKQGTLAKVYKDVEDVRAPATYSMYRQLQNTFQASEPKEAIEL